MPYKTILIPWGIIQAVMNLFHHAWHWKSKLLLRIMPLKRELWKWGIWLLLPARVVTAPLSGLKEGNRVRYRCHTEHSFTASALLAGVSETVEETLWQAMRVLEQNAMLLQHIGEHILDAGNHEAANIFMKKANETAARALIVHDAVFEQERISADLKYQNEMKERQNIFYLGRNVMTLSHKN